jgi:hypothetical protein
LSIGGRQVRRSANIKSEAQALLEKLKSAAPASAKSGRPRTVGSYIEWFWTMKSTH